MRIVNTLLPLELWIIAVGAGPIHQPYRLHPSVNAKRAPFPWDDAVAGTKAAGVTGKVPAVGSGDQADLSSLQSSVQAAATSAQLQPSNSIAGQALMTSTSGESASPLGANGQTSLLGSGESSGQSARTSGARPALNSAPTMMGSAPFGSGTSPSALSSGGNASPNLPTASSTATTSFSRSFSLLTSSTSQSIPFSSTASPNPSTGTGASFSTGTTLTPVSSTSGQSKQTILVVLSMPAGETTVTMSLPPSGTATLTVQESLEPTKANSTPGASLTPSSSSAEISIVPLPTATAGDGQR